MHTDSPPPTPKVNEHAGPPPGMAVPVWLAVLAVALIALCLRPLVSSVGAVFTEVSTGVNMGTGLGGVLTALPTVCFGVAGIVAVPLARRLGMTFALVVGMAAIAIGLLGRAVSNHALVFVVLTIVAVSGAAVGNVLMPAWIKRFGGGEARQARLIATYSGLLILGGSIGALFTPMMLSLSGWRTALGSWGLIAVASTLTTVWILRTTDDARPAARGSSGGAGAVVRSRTVRAMTVLFGVQALHAYAQFGWVPQIFREAGVSPTVAGALQAIIAGLGIVGSVLTPMVLRSPRRLLAAVLVLTSALISGYLGLLLAPATTPWVWATLLGIAGCMFPIAVALIAVRTRSHDLTARVAGFVQPVGYLLAASGPLALGLLRELTGGWTVALLVLIAAVAPLIWAGIVLSRPAWVDDELDGSAPAPA